MLSTLADGRQAGVYGRLHAELPVGAAAAEHEDQAGDGGPALHLPPQMSASSQHRRDARQGHHGGAQDMAVRAA